MTDFRPTEIHTTAENCSEDQEAGCFPLEARDVTIHRQDKRSQGLWKDPALVEVQKHVPAAECGYTQRRCHRPGTLCLILEARGTGMFPLISA